LQGPTVGILSPLMTGYYYGMLISAVKTVVSEAGGRVIAVSTAASGSGYHREEVIEHLAHLAWDRVDGFVTIANAVSLDYLNELGAAGKPVVALGHVEPGFSYPAVLPDNHGGIRQAVDHLVGHGHVRVAFAGSLQHFDVRERYASYCDTLRSHGIETDPALLYDIDDNHEFSGREAARRMLAAGLPSTAVVAACDLNAVGIMAALSEAGLALPAEQAVTGFDDLPGNASLSPSLSSVAQDLGQMGALAGRLLMRMVDGEEVAPGHHVVAGAFAGRESCGCAPADVPEDDLGAHAQLRRARALLGERNDSYYALRKAIRDEHEISLELLRSHESEPRDLEWLSRTEAEAATLALWDFTAHPEGPSHDGRANRRNLDLRAGRAVAHGRYLRVVGTWRPGGATLGGKGKRHRVERFPPQELLSAAGRRNVVLLFPVASKDRDWGILCVVVPLDSAFMGQDTYFQWEALLSAALDHQDALAALRERSRQLHERGEQLALSYRRERDMARAVRASEERYALAARAVNDGLWDWDLDSGTVYYSSRWAEMLGYADDQIGDRPEVWLERVHEDDKQALAAELMSLRAGEQESILHEHRVRTAAGGYLWVLCRGLAVPGGGKPATRIVGSLTDVTERRELEARLRQLALYDALTGLPNRVLFLDRLAQAVAATRRRPTSTYAVLWLDLDGFKVLNDSLGHHAGDELLVQVSQRLRRELREVDTAARFGGDEFAVLLVDVPDQPTVTAVVQRLLGSLGVAYGIEGHEVEVTASIGVAMGTLGYERPDEVLRDADLAMYKAKGMGRGNYAVFDATMRATAVALVRTGTERRQAVRPGPRGSTQMELPYLSPGGHS
jgi:diguanylate cyclase (GGDEF)-like protein/PAS domain S-box-containing protein